MDPADHAWTIAMATGGAPLPPHSPPLRHSGGGLNLAARHILLDLYLHHRGLHLPDRQEPPPAQQPQCRKPGQRRHQRRWQTTSGAPAAGSTPLSAGRKEHPTHSAQSSTRQPPCPSYTGDAPREMGILSGQPPGRHQ